MGVIATEQQAASIGGGSPYTNNLCATKSRAETLGCAISASYSNNQLVELKHLSTKELFDEDDFCAKILYVNSNFRSYNLTKNILASSSGWIPYLLQIAPYGYFGGSYYEVAASRWLVIAPTYYYVPVHLAQQVIQNPNMGYSLNSISYDCGHERQYNINYLYRTWNTAYYDKDITARVYRAPNSARWSNNSTLPQIGNNWPFYDQSEQLIEGDGGCAMADASIAMSSTGAVAPDPSDYCLKGSVNGSSLMGGYYSSVNEQITGYIKLPTLAELVIMMLNFERINSVLNGLRSAGWNTGSQSITPLAYQNYISITKNIRGSRGEVYYARPITGDGGIRTFSYDINNRGSYGYYNQFTYKLRSVSYPGTLIPGIFGALPVVSGDWHLYYNDALDNVF